MPESDEDLVNPNVYMLKVEYISVDLYLSSWPTNKLRSINFRMTIAWDLLLLMLLLREKTYYEASKLTQIMLMLI